MAKRKRGVRVIAGDLKGRLLDYPPQGPFRPVMQRTKSSVFETLGVNVVGSVFVDLYAAAGGMGIEALSRGAGYVCFVERHREALSCLNGNLNMCRVPEKRYRIDAADVHVFLKRRNMIGVHPDIVFADPPYEGTDFSVLLELLGRIVYSESAVVVIEHPTDAPMDLPDSLSLIRTRSFGGTSVSFLDPVGQ